MNTKISIFCDIFPPPFIGGAEGTAKSLFDELKRTNLDAKVHAITSRSREDSVFTFRTLNLYTPYSSFPPKVIRNLWHILELFNPVEILRCVYILKKEKPKFVFCHNAYFWSWSPIIAARILRIPSGIFIHDYGLLCFRRTLWNLRQNKECFDICKTCTVRKKVSSIILNSAKHIFFNSNSTKNIFLRHYGSETLNQNSWVVYPTKISKVPILDVHSKIINSEIEDIGYIGRISQEKGVEDILDVAQNMGIKVHLAGDGEAKYVNKLKYTYQSSTFLGHVPKDDFFKKYSIIVIPSLWSEPFGKIVLEALSAGKIVVLPKSGAFVELSEHLLPLVGISIFPYVPGSKKALSEAMVIAMQKARYVNLSDHPNYLKIPEWNLYDLANFLNNHQG